MKGRIVSEDMGWGAMRETSCCARSLHKIKHGQSALGRGMRREKGGKENREEVRCAGEARAHAPRVAHRDAPFEDSDDLMYGRELARLF